MELNLIVRSKEELAQCVQALIEGIHSGIVAAADAGEGSLVNYPDDIVIKGRLVPTLNAATVTETDTVPANTVTTTETTPEHEIITAENDSGVSENSNQTPPSRTTTRQEMGGDVTEVNIQHETI